MGATQRTFACYTTAPFKILIRGPTAAVRERKSLNRHTSKLRGPCAAGLARYSHYQIFQPRLVIRIQYYLDLSVAEAGRTAKCYREYRAMDPPLFVWRFKPTKDLMVAPAFYYYEALRSRAGMLFAQSHSSSLG